MKDEEISNNLIMFMTVESFNQIVYNSKKE